ncbi:MAG: NADPH:quinone reductase-like Zn-dependent oxidoreductase [Bermanella sp.]
MKAITFNQYGSADVLELTERAKPFPKNDEVLVKVHAASINSWDWELLQGTPFVNRLMFGLLKPKKINILGCDIAGRVEAVGKNVKHLQPGDAVFGDLSNENWGGFAEYLCAPENALVLKPQSITFEEAAAIPQAGLLALQGLVDKGQIAAKQNVLINGAGGGAGTFAVQIAKCIGANVTAVDSGAKLEMLSLLGADKVVDYRLQDFTKNGCRYDLILDMAAHHSFFDYQRALSPTGIYVMVGGSMALVNQLLLLGPFLSIFSSKKMGLLIHNPNPKDLKFMQQLIEEGKVAPIIDKRYPLVEVSDALRYFGSGQAIGKVVITIENARNI